MFVVNTNSEHRAGEFLHKGFNIIQSNIILCSYESRSHMVTVTDGAATLLNISLEESSIDVWSDYYDFGLKSNINGDSYMTSSTLNLFLHNIADEYASFVTLNVIGQSVGGEDILELVMTNGNTLDKSNKSHVLLISGLQGDNLVGPEMTTRFIRHIAKGKHDSKINNLRRSHTNYACISAIGNNWPSYSQLFKY